MTMVPFARPDINAADVEEVATTVRSGWLTTGPRSAALEQILVEETGRPVARVTSSLTAAVPPLLDAMQAFDNFESAIFPAWTFSSVAMEFHRHGLPIRLKDVNPENMMLPAWLFADASLSIIVPTHFAGNVCPLKLLKTANPNSLIIDDAAHLAPAALIDTPAFATLYSFYATKPVCAGEGGAVVMGEGDHVKRFDMARLHGFSSTAFDRYTSSKVSLYDVAMWGHKANMPDMAAALAISQMSRKFEMAQRRKEIIHRYAEEIKCPQLLHTIDSWAHLAMLFIPPDFGVAKFREAMSAKGIGTSVHFTPLYRHSFWCEALYGQSVKDFVESGEASELFPVCEAAVQRAVSIPLYSGMDEASVDLVIASVNEILGDST